MDDTTGKFTAKTRILCVRESLTKSIVSDLVSFAVTVGVIGVGVLAGSVAMQWCGFAMLVAVLIARAHKDRPYKTPQEAADWLRDEYDVTASAKE